MFTGVFSETEVPPNRMCFSRGRKTHVKHVRRRRLSRVVHVILGPLRREVSGVGWWWRVRCVAVAVVVVCVEVGVVCVKGQRMVVRINRAW